VHLVRMTMATAVHFLLDRCTVPRSTSDWVSSINTPIFSSVSSLPAPNASLLFQPVPKSRNSAATESM
jgi:hypothetical protein